jgi:8-oxo-dGTP diphosphatase
VQTRNVNGHVAPALTADAVLLKGRQVLLVRRGREPFRGAWALPGGFVEVGERVEEACRRELLEEAGLKGDVVDLLGVYGDPDRDPRGHTVTVAYVCKVAGIVQVAAGAQRPSALGALAVAAGDDADEARWFDLDALPPLAFDHARILEDARRWLALPGNFEKLGDVDFGACA